MSSQAIRLRLAIRRHAVPEVKLVWPCVASEDVTVAKLLSQVNEVVPLESGDWGLEDYVVELDDGKGGGFECLHFQQVGKIFKEDDQVIIRSLLTGDLKRRRLSGRHQISTDGRHLVDGLPFGRPWLRPPRNRPDLELPPRKRARITYDSDSESDSDDDESDDSFVGDEEDGSEGEPEQLLLEGPNDISAHATFDDADHDSDLDADLDADPDSDFDMSEEEAEEEVEEGQDVDFGLGTQIQGTQSSVLASGSGEAESEEADSELLEELQLLRADNAAAEGGKLLEEVQETPAPDTRGNEALNALLSSCNIDLSALDYLTALRSAFPLTSITSIEAELIRCGKDLRKTFQTLAKTNEPTISFDEMMDRALTGFPDAFQPLLQDSEDNTFHGFSSQGSASNMLKLPGSGVRPLIEEIESIEEPITTTNGGESEVTTATLNVSRSTNEDAQPESTDLSSSDSSSSEELSSESDSDSDSDSGSDDDVNADEDDSDSDNDDELSDQPTQQSIAPKNTDLESADSDSSSNDSDSGDSSSDDLSGEDAQMDDAEDSAEDSSDESSDESSSDSSDDSDSASEPEEVSAKRKGTVTTISEPPAPEQAKVVQNKTAGDESAAPVPPGCGLSRTRKRNARRREAKRLKQLEEPQQAPTIREAVAEDPELLARKQALLDVMEGGSPKSTDDSRMDLTQPQEVPDAQPDTEASAAAESTQRRMKVDMGAGRRMLFGALGLKNPKSKADEDKLRKSLMKDVRPLKNAHTEEETPKTENVEVNGGEEENPEAWREKVTLRAVECCHGDMVLSEPPFPFVQRWDPQQQYNTMRKRKRNSQHYDDYYGQGWHEEDSQVYDDEVGWGEEISKSKRRSKGGGSQSAEKASDNIILDYDDVPTKQLASDAFTDVDDLPSLPEDLALLPSLQQDDIKSGMVITWKQLLMSKATNWQPQVSSVTGLVLSVDDAGTFRILLAKRDREQNEKVYDHNTGKRIYEKFEAPDLDEEDDDEDDGFRDLKWPDLTEPRLLQPAPAPSRPTTPTKDSAGNPANGISAVENNKVSHGQIREESVAEELDTQEVRAAVEADLKEAAAKKTESDTSTSIPSRQHIPRLDIPEVYPNLPTNTTADSTNISSDPIDGRGQELEESRNFLSNMKPSSQIAVDNVQTEDSSQSHEAVDAEMDTAEFEEEAMALDESVLDEVIPDSLLALEIPERQLEARNENNGFSLSTEGPMPTAASPTGSIQSGRQPFSNHGHDDLQEHVCDSVIPETEHGTHEQDQAAQSPQSDRSSSPLHSLKELFHSARTQSQNASQVSGVGSQKIEVKPDLEYEEAMRELDEGDDSDQSRDRNKTIRNIFSNATQPDAATDLPRLPSPKPDIPTKLARPRREKSPFAIPEGSQVITLSSSPGPTPAEYYAEDEIDDTYHDSSSLPTGAGWVKKNKHAPSTRGPGRPKQSARATRSGEGSTPGLDRSASAVSQIKARRKTRTKF